jgi:hypothetical protein
MINSYSGEGNRFKVKYRQQHNSGHFYECGLSNVMGHSDEDRFAIYQADENSAGFGVFDGHGGKGGAEICSASILSKTYEQFEMNRSTFTENMPNQHDYSEEEIYDALFCESAKQSAEIIHEAVVANDRSGSTCNLLCLHRDGKGTVKAKCVNIGDSRCVVMKEHAGVWKAINVSEDHSLTLTREVSRITDQLPVDWQPLPADPFKFDANLDDSVNMPFPAHPPEAVSARARTIVSALKAPSPTVPEETTHRSQSPIRQESISIHSGANSLSSSRHMEERYENAGDEGSDYSSSISSKKKKSIKLLRPFNSSRSTGSRTPIQRDILDLTGNKI